ncbi:MAG: FHA domain-containing protein [Lentisphaerae bacterium]|nr:FHA domain-containing protein [Lentisphaerota bacterium]MBT5611840.1 FHA domain-containing protein [Lentisphaerota bacterium]MBT7059297.1 FHA domain-containing protein [Lentisphaerota bacterium]MBT7843820.1 FHA domain-containing protein [Lentisphaerota bacterium]
MAFQFHIRQHIDASEDAFVEGDVRTFDGERVRVGRGMECECRLDDPVFREVHFEVHSSPDSNYMVCHPRPDAEMCLGDRPLRSEHDLLSGDEIRVGVYTFRVQRLFATTGRGSRFGFLSLVAKVLVALILAVEVTIAAWLPCQVRATSRLQEEITRQRTILRLDHLRAMIGGLALTEGLEQAAVRVISEELRTLARYLRENEQRLSREEWGQVGNDLESYDIIICALRDKTAFRPLPAVDVDAGVRAALKAREAR